VGYRRTRNIYKLTFADGEFEGLEVRAHSLPTGQFLDLAGLADLADSKKFSKDDIGKLEGLFQGFAKALVSWNLEEEDGTPIPATLEGVKGQEIEFILTLIMEWMGTIGGISDPLASRSTSGETSLELSIPMEIRSGSQQS
jgi:hypothetical protein